MDSNHEHPTTHVVPPNPQHQAAFGLFAAQVVLQCAVQRGVSYAHPSRPMKFVFLFWVTFWGVIDASIWVTALWCLLGYFNVLWLQCFWVFIPIHFVRNISVMKYVGTHTKQDCLFYMRRESMSIGVALILALATSIIPTVAVILLLSLSELWTNLQTHWLHTWLCVTCILYIFARGSEKRKMRKHTRARTVQNTARRSRFVRMIDV